MLFAGTGVVLDGPLILFSEGRTPHFRAWVTFGRSGPLTFLFHASGGPISFSSERNGGKNAAKNQWFLVSFARFKCGRKRFHRESATSLPPLPLTRWAVGLDGPTGLGDHQIAHLPPAAASVGAARWAAGI